MALELQATEPRLSHEDVPRVNVVERRDDQRRQRASIFPRRQERVFAVEDFPTSDDRSVERQAATKVRSSYLQGGSLRTGSPQRGERNSSATADAEADSSSSRQGPSSPLSPQQRNRGSGGIVSSPRTGRRGSLSNMASRGGWEAARDAAASDGFGGGGNRGRGSSVEDCSRGEASHADSDSNPVYDTRSVVLTVPHCSNARTRSPHVRIHPTPTVSPLSPTPGAAPSQQSTWRSTVPLRLPALLSTPEWSIEDCYGDGGDGMGGGMGGGCGSISEFRRQRRLERDRMYRDAIGSTLSTFSQAKSSRCRAYTRSASYTLTRSHPYTHHPLTSTPDRPRAPRSRSSARRRGRSILVVGYHELGITRRTTRTLYTHCAAMPSIYPQASRRVRRPLSGASAPAPLLLLPVMPDGPPPGAGER